MTCYDVLIEAFVIVYLELRAFQYHAPDLVNGHPSRAAEHLPGSPGKFGRKEGRKGVSEGEREEKNKNYVQ